MTQPIDNTPKVLLLKLVHHANDDGVCHPGQDSIAEAIGRSNRQVRTLIGNLETAGLIKKRSRGKKGGGRNSDEYLIMWKADMDWPNRKPTSASNRKSTSALGSNRKPTSASVTPRRGQTGSAAQGKPEVQTSRELPEELPVSTSLSIRDECGESIPRTREGEDGWRNESAPWVDALKNPQVQPQPVQPVQEPQLSQPSPIDRIRRQREERERRYEERQQKLIESGATA